MRSANRSRKKKAIAVDVATLAQYEGVYRIDKDNVRVLRMVEGKLTSQRTSGKRFNLIPVARDTFLFDGNEGFSRMAFERNASGGISAMRFFPQDEGEGDVVPRTDEPMPTQHVAISLPKSAPQRLVENYAHDDMAVTIALQGDQFSARTEGQPASDIFAESPTRFFLKEVDATLDFAPGEASPASVILHQGSQDIEFKRRP